MEQTNNINPESTKFDRPKTLIAHFLKLPSFLGCFILYDLQSLSTEYAFASFVLNVGRESINGGRLEVHSPGRSLAIPGT
jgi:hypothetical protein